MTQSTRSGPRALLVGVGLVFLAICALPFLGGEALIRGVGNSSNRIYTDRTTEELAQVLASHEAVPPISDAALAETFAAIERRARSGELEPALLLFRVAALQRGEDR